MNSETIKIDLKSIIIFILLVALFFIYFGGVNNQKSEIGKYFLAVPDSRTAYKINTQTGEVFLLKGETKFTEDKTPIVEYSWISLK